MDTFYQMPLRYVLQWQPFRIDALGLVTIIGAEQVDTAVGRLTRNPYADFLPLLGAYTIASNSFTGAIPGFNFYNIAPAQLHSNELAGWFARWCISQDFSRGGSSVRWSTDETWTDALRRERRQQRRLKWILAMTIGVLVHGFLIGLTTLQGDWWGLANVASMALSVLVRNHVVSQNRSAIDAAVMRNRGKALPLAKLYVTFNDGKQINMFAPPTLVKALFIDKPVLLRPTTYSVARYLGWLAFITHIIAIGMSGLATQIVTVVVILVSTIITLLRMGCDDGLVGTRLHAHIATPGSQGSERRQDAFLELQLSHEEEEMLLGWHQMPLRDNVRWWREYKAKKAKKLGK